MVICHRRLTNIYTIVREFMRMLARTAFDIPNDSLMSPTDTDHHAYHLTSNMRYHGNQMIYTWYLLLQDLQTLQVLTTPQKCSLDFYCCCALLNNLKRVLSTLIKIASKNGGISHIRNIVVLYT